ncbi:MAG: filamentous hemagglutinin N-terminal domain-containing protein [Oscillatoriales cyanobacterium C42_A2020_001]|nr:filamentous hemagglutinin N-terminal domain-containing protein [Leptolyngbyaceae cyanobacterium C42_A2020_001]
MAQLPQWVLLQRSIWFAALVLTLAEPHSSLAQLIPDTSLGTHSSTISTNGLIDTVNGGVRTGGNLFHSFLEFNVGTGRSLYFNDPGVTNILTRVTGVNPSTINGRLGVNGNANLFLLNPNGILFGAGASLDVRGSFTATTAAAVKFSDGSEFSATNPTVPNLLTISVPVGLQRGIQQPSATIVNRGTLSTGQDLTLAGDRLDLQGQLQAGGNLTLQATDTVHIRDTFTEPFLAQAGGDLTVQGDRGIDILALNHSTWTAFQSGGNLSLVSDGVISGDARFASQRNFEVRPITQELATFISLYDPIITSAGDVNLALNYTGASLLVEAGGNIRVQGILTITTPDTAAPFVGDDAILNTRPGLILRSGQTTRRYGTNSGTVTGSSTGFGIVPAPGITLNRRVNVANGGVVRLTTGGTGDIRTQQIDVAAGEITVNSGGSINTNGRRVDTSTSNGNGGTIRLMQQAMFLPGIYLPLVMTFLLMGARSQS